MAQTLDTLGQLEKHEPSGMFYNWYDPATGEKLTTWPDERRPGQPVPLQRRQRLAGHRAAGRRARRADAGREGRRDPQPDGLRLLLQRGAGASHRRPARRRPDPRRLLGRGPDAGCSQLGDYCKPGTDPSTTPATTTARSTPSRGWRRTSASPSGQIPAKHYFGTFRTFHNDNCDYSWTETKPVGEWKTYDGIPVFEGALPYRGMNIVPTWGGSMFEALMVPLFVPEEKWGPQSLGRQPPALRARPDRARHGRGRLRLLGLLAVQQPGRRLPRVRRRRARHGRRHPGRRRLHHRPGAHRLWTRPTRAAATGEPGARRRTATAWSPRTRRSSPTATRRRPRWRTWPSCARLRRLRARRLLRRHRRRQRHSVASATCRSTRA